MDKFNEYINKIEDEKQRAILIEVLSWIIYKFPQLETKVAWNQPMFTYKDTFIIGFSISKTHLAVAPEAYTISHYSSLITKCGYSKTANLFKIKWNDKIDFSLLEEIINFNIEDKKESTTFWRK